MLEKLKNITEPASGSSGKKGGFGGALLAVVILHDTHAVVETGAHVYSGPHGGFNIKAEEALAVLSFSQAGAEGGEYGIAGTFENKLRQISGDLAAIVVFHGNGDGPYPRTDSLRSVERPDVGQ